MLDLMQLRETVNLPSGYNAKLPINEREDLLRRDLAEYKFRNRMLGYSKKPKTAVVKKAFSGSGRDYTRSTYNTKTAVMIRFIASVGRANAREIESATGFKYSSIGPLLIYMKTDGLVVQNGSKRFKGGRMMQAIEVTPAGIIYGAKK